MQPQCSHITAKRGWFYYRRRLPRPHRGEVAVALRTTNFREAQYLGARLDQAYRRFLRSKPPAMKLQDALNSYLREALQADLDQHIGTPPGRPVYTTLRYGGQDPLEADSEVIRLLLDEARERLARRDYREIAKRIDALMEHYKLPPEMGREFALGILQADVIAFEAAEKRIETGPLLDVFSDSTKTAAASDSSLAVGDRIETGSLIAGEVLSALIPNFVEIMVTEEGWRGQTVAQNTATYRMFIAHCGDRAPRAYQRADLSNFYHLLRGLPADYSKNAKWRELALRDVSEQSAALDLPRLAVKTRKRHFSALGRLFEHLKEHSLVSENPARGFSFPQKGRANRKRQMWANEPLQRLFASPVWTGCRSESRRSSAGSLIIRDEKYWLPVLGLYHGNRLEEFAQLRAEDIKNEDGIDYFYINGEGARQLKNEQSTRRVPMHSAVIDLGFLDYVRAVAPNPSDLVFPELRPGGPDKKLGFYFTKWFSRYRREIGLYEKGLDYHSFRHGVTTKLYSENVSQATIDELTGHEGTGTSSKVYKKDMPLAVLKKAIESIKWPEVPLQRP